MKNFEHESSLCPPGLFYPTQTTKYLFLLIAVIILQIISDISFKENSQQIHSVPGKQLAYTPKNSRSLAAYNLCMFLPWMQYQEQDSPEITQDQYLYRFSLVINRCGYFLLVSIFLLTEILHYRIRKNWRHNAYNSIIATLKQLFLKLNHSVEIVFQHLPFYKK